MHAPPRPDTSGATWMGLLLVDKPAGITSHDVVARVRRALRTKRVGHAGTLDPFATGLLVCAVGQATRLLPYVHGEPKVYRARIAFGTATDTDDATGTVIANGPRADWEALADSLERLTGRVQQIPPAYSAKHVDGQRAYALARRGNSVDLPPVDVVVHEWHVINRGDDWLDAQITCGGGTYVRALARDFGVALGTVAHCASLRRISSGELHVQHATSMDALTPDAPVTLLNPHAAMSTLATEVVSADGLMMLRVGRQIPATVAGTRAALVRADGCVVGVGERVITDSGDRWQPRVVLLDAEPAS